MLRTRRLHADIGAGGRRASCYLRSTANLSTGGTAIDVTDVIHPDNRDMAVRAVQAIGLDVGGVDFITTEHRRELPRRSAAASARSTPRPASACTSRRAKASRATSPAR